jgi:hypothetical protein
MPHLHEDPARTTPIGLARYAAEFLSAARAANDGAEKKGTDQDVAPVPVMFLLGQSIELALKAYLLNRGVTLRDLRVMYSHGLRRSHRKARELGFAAFYSPSAEDLVALHLLDELYETKQLQYIVTGRRRIPPYSVLERIAFQVLHAAAPQAGYPADRLPRSGA